MKLAFVLLIAGGISGLARGGRVANIAKVDLSLPWLVFAGLAIQLVAQFWASFFDSSLRDRAGLPILLASYALLLAFVVVNRRWPGVVLIGAGMALNLIVIFANGGMPVSLKAARAAGLDSTGADFLDTAVKHRPMGSQTVLWFLGDWIPLPVVGAVVSVGDVVLGLGIFLLMERVVRYEPRRLGLGRPTKSSAGARGPSEGT